MTDQSQPDEAKSPTEAAIEALVYAPIGLLFEGASLLPQLIEKGRNQVTMARMIGKMAVDQAGVEATKAAGKLQDQAAGVLDFIGGSVTPVPDDQAQEPPAPAPAAATKATAKRAAKRSTGAARAAARKVAGAVEAGVEAASLAIPDYDGLSASHVVNRLAGLSAPELESVRLYEIANRGRKTILSKISQLQP